MKTGKIILAAFFGLIFSTAVMAQTEGTNPRKEIKKDVVAVEKVDAQVSLEQIAQPAKPLTDEAPAEKIVDDKDKKKKSAKKSCCSKDKEEATKGCGKKD